MTKKTAFISGGTHGIGLEIAKQFVKSGVNVVICSRTIERIREAEQILKKENASVEVMGFQLDAIDLDSIDNAVSIIEQKGIDICINNVGGGGRWGKENILETDFNVWQEVYNKNVNATIKFTMACLPHMIKSGWGRVVAIVSMYGKQAGGRPWFNMAKASEISFIKNLSLKREYARRGITFNSVAPGGIFIEDTGWDDLKKNNPMEYERIIDTNCPMGRLGTTEEVANVVSFLCSYKASYVNGSCITVDGGESVAY